MRKLTLIAVALFALTALSTPVPAFAKSNHGGHARYQKVAPSGKPQATPVKKKKVAKASKQSGGSQAWSKSSGKGH